MKEVWGDDMIISKVKLQNWRNFKSAEAELQDVTYVIGPNASGKSNFLDVFRFLRDIAKPAGGGLRKAIDMRGKLKKLRCLHARNVTDVGIEIEISDHAEPRQTIWKYELYFNLEERGHRRPIVKKELVTKFDETGNPEVVLDRPNSDDKADPERLTQTALEQIQANSEFREVAEFFSNTTYVHLVPQLLKYADLIGGQKLEDDPFGQSFMERVSSETDRNRKSRLKRIEGVLKAIIPQIEQLVFVRDEVTGLPHLEVRYKHHRPQGAIQREDQFSDGTLRLISLFWLLMEGPSLLLLEEPELSLNEEIVEQIPALIDRALRSTRKKRRQVFITTHSRALLSNAGIDGRSILILAPSGEGTSIENATEDELNAMEIGLSPADIILPRAQKVSVDTLQLELRL